MTICHFILGRPCERNRWTHHDGHLNTYTFEYKGKHIVLHPLPPQHRLVKPPSPAPSTFLLVDIHTFLAETNKDTPVPWLTSVLAILVTTIPEAMKPLLKKFDHLC